MGSGIDVDMQGVYDSYVEKYGQDNADYLMEVMGAWQKHYNRAAFIDLGIGDVTEIEEKTRAEASRRGWTFERMQGDISIIRRLVQGTWNDDFLVVPPGRQVAMTATDDIIKSE